MTFPDFEGLDDETSIHLVWFWYDLLGILQKWPGRIPATGNFTMWCACRWKRWFSRFKSTYPAESLSSLAVISYILLHAAFYNAFVVGILLRYPLSNQDSSHFQRITQNPPSFDGHRAGTARFRLHARCNHVWWDIQEPSPLFSSTFWKINWWGTQLGLRWFQRFFPFIIFLHPLFGKMI